MGIYIDIVLRNSKTGEEKVFEFWSAKPYSEAWTEAIDRGLVALNDIWSLDGDARYWYLKSLTDAVRR